MLNKTIFSVCDPRWNEDVLFTGFILDTIYLQSIYIFGGLNSQTKKQKTWYETYM